MKKQKNTKGGWIGVGIGLSLIFASYLIYLKSNSLFLLEVHSEIFGAGIVIALLSAVFVLFRLKVQG